MFPRKGAFQIVFGPKHRDFKFEKDRRQLVNQQTAQVEKLGLTCPLKNDPGIEFFYFWRFV